MQSHWIRTAGSGTALEVRDVPVPAPGAGQLLLRVHAAGLNRGEFIAGHGLHQPGAAKPIGIEGAGEVVEIGAGITRFARGERVFGRFPAAFSEYALISEEEAMPVPESLSMEEAAGIPVAFSVVHDILFAQGRIASGEWMLIAGVSSGVGVAALQTAAALGIKVIGTSGSAEKLERLRALGLHTGLCTRSADFHEAVMRATQGRGVDLVVNTVGGSVFAECLRTMAFQGRLAQVGYVDGVFASDLDIEALHTRRLTLFGVSNKLRSVEQRAAATRGFAADMLPLIAQRGIRPLVDRVFPLAKLAAAKAHMESDLHLGKIVVAVQP